MREINHMLNATPTTFRARAVHQGTARGEQKVLVGQPHEAAQPPGAPSPGPLPPELPGDPWHHPSTFSNSRQWTKNAKPGRQLPPHPLRHQRRRRCSSAYRSPALATHPRHLPPQALVSSCTVRRKSLKHARLLRADDNGASSYPETWTPCSAESSTDDVRIRSDQERRRRQQILSRRQGTYRPT